MSAHSETLDFMLALAEVRAIFRDIHLQMERSGYFSEIGTSLIPFSGRASVADSNRASLNLTVDGELKNWIDTNKKAFGVSFMISHSEGRWLLEREYGWSGQEVGWDPIYSSDEAYATSRDLILNLTTAATDFRAIAAKFIAEHFAP